MMSAALGLGARASAAAPSRISTGRPAAALRRIPSALAKSIVIMVLRDKHEDGTTTSRTEWRGVAGVQHDCVTGAQQLHCRRSRLSARFRSDISRRIHFCVKTLDVGEGYTMENGRV